MILRFTTHLSTLLFFNYVPDHIKGPKIRNHALNFWGGPSYCAPLSKQMKLVLYCSWGFRKVISCILDGLRLRKLGQSPLLQCPKPQGLSMGPPVYPYGYGALPLHHSSPCWSFCARHEPGLFRLQKAIFAASCKNFCILREIFCSLSIFCILCSNNFFATKI